jgi:hypothetical protein
MPLSSFIRAPAELQSFRLQRSQDLGGISRCMKECEQERDTGRQCPAVLVMVKGGESPPRGQTRGNRVTRARDDGSPCRRNPCFGLTGKCLEGSVEQLVTGVAPRSELA